MALFYYIVIVCACVCVGGFTDTCDMCLGLGKRHMHHSAHVGIQNNSVELVPSPAFPWIPEIELNLPVFLISTISY